MSSFSSVILGSVPDGSCFVFRCSFLCGKLSIDWSISPAPCEYLDEAYLIMVNDLFDVFLDSVFNLANFLSILLIF
ncbi:hypothetical protein H671_5g14446 [Cricetulus griseus]|nr:hypothetical protein H671_5g14446 [Cricetulus griseus]